MREITSPVKKFPGTVVLPDALTWPQYFAWSEAVSEASEMDGAHRTHRLMVGELACVLEWKIAGIPEKPTPDTFPSTPVLAVVSLVSWIMGELTGMITEADEAPN